MPNEPTSGSTGVLTFEVDRFLEDLQFYESASMSFENEVFGHAVLNLPALSDEGIPELRQHYKMKTELQQIDPTIPHIEFLGISPSEVRIGDRLKMIHRWRITLSDLPSFLIEGFPEDYVQNLREQIQYLQKQYPESFSRANQGEGQLFSDKFLQERLAKIEEIRQMALSGSLFD